MEQNYNKLSKEVVHQLPSFVRENYDTFIAFLKAYYEYIEQEGKVQYVIKNARSYLDVDDTVDEFVDFFLNQYAYTLPKAIFDSTTDESKRLFVKYASNLYKSKGSESAYRLLFRLIYGEEISFFYPNTVLFKPSSGDWKNVVSIKSEYLSGDSASNIRGKSVHGMDSGATAIVDFVSSFEESNKNIYELFLEKDSIRGEFNGGETLVIGNYQANVTALNVISSIEVIDGLKGYNLSDNLVVNGTSTTAARISKIGLGGEIKEIGISLFGVDVDAPNVSVSIGQPSKTFVGTYTVTSNVATLSVPEKHYLDKGDIANITFQTGNATVLSGNNEVIELVGLRAFRVEAPVANTSGVFSMQYVGQANLQPVVGPLCQYIGTYGQDFQGQVDHDIKLQDSRFYQQFSYVVRSNIGIDQWRDVVKSVLHPAGFALFGELFIQSELGEESIYVGVDNAYDALVIYIRAIISELENGQLAGMPGNTHQPTVDIKISPIINIESSPDVLGPNRWTVDKFKFQYDEHTPIDEFSNLAIEFFTEFPNKNISWYYAPPSELFFVPPDAP